MGAVGLKDPVRCPPAFRANLCTGTQHSKMRTMSAERGNRGYASLTGPWFLSLWAVKGGERDFPWNSWAMEAGTPVPMSPLPAEVCPMAKWVSFMNMEVRVFEVRLHPSPASDLFLSRTLSPWEMDRALITQSKARPPTSQALYASFKRPAQGRLQPVSLFLLSPTERPPFVSWIPGSFGPSSCRTCRAVPASTAQLLGNASPPPLDGGWADAGTRVCLMFTPILHLFLCWTLLNTLRAFLMPNSPHNPIVQGLLLLLLCKWKNCNLKS